MNIDETSVARSFAAGRGLVVTARTPGGLGQDPFQRIRGGELRGPFTHVAMATPHQELQRLLPQVFIGGSKNFTEPFVHQFNTEAPGPVYFWRGRSCWNNTGLMVRFLELLAAVLRPWLLDWQPIILVDTSSCHLSAAVVSKANDLGMWLLVAPASLTWLLAPLDTNGFAAYKAFLRREYRVLASLAPNGVVPQRDWGQLLSRVATEFLQSRNWAKAFSDNGIVEQTSLSKVLLRQLGPCTELEVTSVPRGAPSTDDLKQLFPRNRRVNVAAFFQPVVEALLAPP